MGHGAASAVAAREGTLREAASKWSEYLGSRGQSVERGE